MTLREMTLAELKALHRTELHEAFPPSELKPFAAMKTLYAKGVYHPLGAYDGEALLGYALLVVINLGHGPAEARPGQLWSLTVKTFGSETELISVACFGLSLICQG